MAMPQKLSPVEQNRLVAAYGRGDSLVAIADEFGVSFSTIRSYALKAGVTLRSVGRPRKVAVDA